MKTKEENIIITKSYSFAVRCVRLYKFLCDERHDYKADFTAKMSISLKEASESEFWIELLRDTGYITEQQADSMLQDCQELLKLLMSIVKTSKQ